jgi:hypothetical protein
MTRIVAVVSVWTAGLAVTVMLVGCSFSPPLSDADQANLAACTQQADATYQANNNDELARTSQNAVRYSATPNHVFDAEQMGAMNERNNQINDCVQNGNTIRPVIPGPPLVTPTVTGVQP